MNLKEKFTNKLGSLGGILYLLISFILPIFPIAMIVLSFNLPFWTNFIFIAILFILPSISTVFWLIGLIGVVIGPQDVIAIIYYVAFALLCLPTIICIIIGFFIKD